MDVSRISNAYAAVKAIKDIANSLLDAELEGRPKRLVSEALKKLEGVQDALFYVREELLQGEEENAALRAKLQQLESAANPQRLSYLVKEEGFDDIPYCKKCYGEKQKMILLQGGERDVWSCPECRNTYYGPNYTPPSPRGKPSESAESYG